MKRVILAILTAATFGHGDIHQFEDDLERGDWAAVEKKGAGNPSAAALILLYQGRYEEALKSWPTSLDSPLKSYLEVMAQLAPLFSEKIQTGAFELRLAPRDRVLQEAAASSLNSCRRQVADWMGAEPRAPVITEIYRRKKDFALASTLGDELLKKSGVIGIAKFNRIMLITPEALPFGYSWQDTLCHEYIHHALKTKTGLTLPLWFQEGMARAFESIWRKGGLEIPPGDREELLLAAQEGRLVRFARMEPSMVYLDNEAQISLAFTQVALGVKKLEPKLHELIRLSAQGLPFDKALKKVTGRRLEDFENALWHEWREEAAKTKIKKSGALRTVLSMGSEPAPETLYLGPKSAQLLSLGDQLRAKGNLSAALRLYEQAKEQEPLNPYILSRIARAQSALGSSDQALKTAEELTRANPRWPPGHEIIGEILESRSHYQEAIKAYVQYFDFNPYHQELYRRVAFLHIDLGEPLSAKPYLEKALILNPKDTECQAALNAITR